MSQQPAPTATRSIEPQLVPTQRRPADVIPVGSPQWRRAWLYGVSTWAAAGLGYLIVTAMSWFIQGKDGPPLNRMLEIWGRWDTGHYLTIAQFGYPEGRMDSPAFFPLYPILIHVFDAVLPGGALAAALVLSNLACVGALVMLYRLADGELGERLAGRTLLYLVAWPGAFFFFGGYNESLFLLLSVAALYCMRRGAWWAAGALGAAASATRLAGVLLGVAFAIEYARHRGWRLDGWRPQPPPGRRIDLRALGILLIPGGLVSYAIYWWIRADNPLAFSRAQAEWGREYAPPWSGLAEATGGAFGRPLLEQMALHNFFDLLTYVCVITLLILGVVGRWRLRPDQFYLTAYAAASLFVVLIGPVGGLFPLQGSMRYTAELVPIFFVLARIGENRHIDRLYMLPAVMAQVTLLLSFINDVFVG